MEDEAPGVRADRWLFTEPRDALKQPRDVIIERMISDRLRAQANWASLKSFAKNVGLGIGLTTGAIAVAQSVGWMG